MAKGFVSEAQRRKWEQLRHDGKVSDDQFTARDQASADALPERAAPRHRTVGPSRSADAAKLNDQRY